MDYCRCCKTFDKNVGKKRGKYCARCGSRNKDKRPNKYESSENFIYESFNDCIDSESWAGFKNVKYSCDIKQDITSKFPEIKYCHTGQIKDYKKTRGIYLYTLYDQDYNLLKVGQTTNTTTRFIRYDKNLSYDLFTCPSWDSQDLHEKKLRNYMEFIGFLLPMDLEDGRLKYIKELNLI